jgi:O-Antigen ligase
VSVDRQALKASELAQTQRLRIIAITALLVVAALLLGPLAGSLVVAGRTLFVVFLSALALPILFWKVPSSPVIFLVAAAASINRLADNAPDAITARIPLYRSLSETYHVSGPGVLLPIEMVLGISLLVWIAKAISERRLTVRASQLGVSLALVMVAALITEGVGLARHGDVHISIWELRPFVYLWIAYLLGSQLLTTRSALWAVLWGFVIGVGTKALEGTERVITLRNVTPRPDALLEHEESVFFSCFIVITLALWVLGIRGGLRRLATALLPLVLVADLGNNRRVSFVMLPLMLLAFVVIAYLRMPERRKLIGVLVGTLLIIGVGYVAVFKESDSLIATPAHAIWSQFRPDPRDASSNQYRVFENINLGLDIRHSPILGEGFGVPIAHPVPVFDASDTDPLINFIPHNNILYVWLRMGVLGMIAFWFMVGAAVVAACRLSLHPDRFLALFGIIALTTVIAWLFEGWYDKGIVDFRVVFIVGGFLGALGAATRMAAAEPRLLRKGKPAAEAAPEPEEDTALVGKPAPGRQRALRQVSPPLRPRRVPGT